MTFTIDVTVLTGPPGCGKTSEFINEMLSNPGRYLFAMPRSDLIEERVQDLQARAEALGVNLVIVPIHSGQGFRAPVRRRIKDAAYEHQSDPHVIVLATHEAIKSIDLTAFAGWHARIDEIPDAVASDGFRVPASWRLLEAIYELDPIRGTKWSKVIVRPDAPTMRDMMNDEVAADLDGFHKLTGNGVYVDLTEWKEAATRKRVQWWAAWTPLELAHFATIKFAASGYFTSLLYRATEAWCPGQVRYHRYEVGAERTAWPKVQISYYTRGHRASTAFWKTDQGRECLNKVGRHLSSVRDLGFWSGNELVQERFAMSLAGKKVSPKQAGTNVYRHVKSCGIVYSNKSQRADEPLLEVFGLSKEDIERARQTEDIEQFVMRGAIRCPNFGGTYNIYLYDVWQAEALKTFLEGHGIADVELIGLDEVGIMDEERPKPGRKPASTDSVLIKRKAEERKEADRLRKARTRAEERQRQAQAGTLRGRGRPPKQAA